MQTARNTAGKAIQPKRMTSPKKDKMTMCPAIILAKSRIIKAALRTTDTGDLNDEKERDKPFGQVSKGSAHATSL